MQQSKFAPREIFEQILEWAVIPTFDLVVEYQGSIVIVKRKIAPYKNQWALPGLRMYKGENIDDTLKRIALKELGLVINPSAKQILGQYVGRFKTEHQRQDISTGYLIRVTDSANFSPNLEHFSAIKFISSKEEIPRNTGSMYRFFLNNYFSIHP